MPIRPTRSPLVWLLDLTIGGRVHRLSSYPLDVSIGGVLVPYDGGLDSIELPESLPGPGGAPDERSASIDLILGSDLSALVALGLDLSTATAELSLLVDGDPHELRDVRICGRLQLAQSGGLHEVLSFTIADEPVDDAARVVPSEQTVDPETWPTARNDAIGEVYPWPWGTPGVLTDTDGSLVYAPGSPALPVETSGGGVDSDAVRVDRLLVANGQITATTVGLWRESDDGGRLVRTGTAAIEYVNDGRGHECATIDTSGFLDITRRSGAYWIDFGEGGAGVRSSWHGGAIRGHGDLLRTLARMGDPAIDLASWAALDSLLLWSSSGYVADDIAPFDLILDLIEHTPIALLARGGGLAPVRWGYGALAVHAVERLVEGDGVARVGRPSIEREQGDLVTQIRIGYGLDADLDRVMAWRLFTGNKPSARTETSNVYLKAAALRARLLDRAREMAIELPWADRVSAGQSGAWLSRYLTTSPVSIPLDVEQVRCLHLEPGQIVLYNDAGLSIVDAVAIVQRRLQSTSPVWRVEIVLLDQVVSGSHTAGSGASGDQPPFVHV